MYLGYTYLSLINIITGINQLEPNLKEIKNQLNKSPEIMSEAIQCILRKNGIENGYDIIRSLTQTIQFKSLNNFKQKIIDKLIEKNVPKTICDEILALDYNNYLGYYNI
jgi:adenylosuccinate lyase